MNLCEYQNDVILVNVAVDVDSLINIGCKLYDNYKDRGFTVLGIPSRDFLQEYRDEKDTAEFCPTEYGVEFPMFATTKVQEKALTFIKNFQLKVVYLQHGTLPNT